MAVQLEDIAGPACPGCDHWMAEVDRITKLLVDARGEVMVSELVIAIKSFLEAIDDSIDELSPRAFNAYGRCVEAIANAEGRTPRQLQDTVVEA